MKHPDLPYNKKMVESMCILYIVSPFHFSLHMYAGAVTRSYEHQRRKLKTIEMGMEHEDKILKQKSTGEGKKE